MPLITSATNTGLSIKQLAISAAPLGAAAVATTTSKKFAVEEQNLSAILTSDMRANVSKISSINVKDIGVLTISATDFKDNASLISKLSGNRQFNVTGATMAEMSTLVKNKNVASITVSDTAANIQAGMGTLISNNRKFNAASITKTDPATDITISSANYKQANAAGGVFSKFAASSFASPNLKVTGAFASDFASILADSTKVKNVAIADSVANIFKNADAITTAIAASPAKVGTVTATAAKTPFMRIEATGANGYAAYTAANSGLITKVNAGNANALKDAFVLTGALIADVTVGIIGDTQVKSVEVADTAANAVAATTAVLSKVTKADLTADKADVDSTLLTQLAGLGSKLSSLKLNAGEGDTLDGVDVSNIKNKATALVLAKTKGEYGDPVGLEVTGAKLADVNGLMANKQVNKADISDTAKNMLAFSADKFTMLANSKNVSFAITDSAANISKYHTQLASAVKQFNTDRVSLSVKDTAANLEKNLEALDEVATAITGADANGQSKYDSSRVKIQQSATTGGVAETSTLIKVAYANYSERRDVLQYIKDATAGMVQAHVQVDTANTDIAATADPTGDARSAWSVQRAKDISTTLQFQRYIVDAAGLPTPAPTPPNPTTNKLTMTGGTDVIGGIGIRAANNSIANDSSTFGISSGDGKTWITGAVGKTANKLYSDIAQIDITLRGTNVSADLVKIKANNDLKTGTLATDLLKAVTTSVSMYV